MEDLLTKILFVDDDEDDFIIVRELLLEATHGKFKLEWADSYEKGMKKIDEVSHEIYLIDYRLGVKNGLEFIKEARDKGFDKP